MLPRCQGWLAVVGLLACSCPVAADRPGTREAPFGPAAKAFVALLGKGEFEKATGVFDEAMRKALAADRLKETWANIVADAGAFQKRVAQPRRQEWEVRHRHRDMPVREEEGGRPSSL